MSFNIKDYTIGEFASHSYNWYMVQLIKEIDFYLNKPHEMGAAMPRIRAKEKYIQALDRNIGDSGKTKYFDIIMDQLLKADAEQHEDDEENHHNV